MKNKCVLIISDQHFPYNHPDIISFLKRIKKEFKPDRVVNIGDEIDGHAISFHESDPDLLSASDELDSAIKKLQPLYKLFPKMDLLESNHGSLVYRKGKFAGLPRHVFKSYRDILGAPKGWNWHFDLTLTLPDNKSVYFCHGKTGTSGKLSKNMAMHTVQGHFHSKFQINYWSNMDGLYWDAHVGCLIDDQSLAFSYNKVTVERPIIGCLVILNGQPKLIPMLLKKNRWVGHL